MGRGSSGKWKKTKLKGQKHLLDSIEKEGEGASGENDLVAAILTSTSVGSLAS